MKPPKYLLVTDATAAQVYSRTGLEGRDTLLGTLVENPTHALADFNRGFAELNAILHPRDPRCRCYTGAVINLCPIHSTVT